MSNVQIVEVKSGAITTAVEAETRVVEVGVSARQIVKVERAERIVDVVPEIKIVEAGRQGPPGIAGGTVYTHTQIGASAVWTINHNLGRYPAISLLSPGLAEFLGEILHTSINQAIVYLAVPQSGLAQCN